MAGIATRGISIILLLLFSSSIHALTITTNDRVTSYVVVRSGPGGEEVGRLRPGKSFEYVESIAKYHVVKLESGKYAYVSKAYTTIIDDNLNAAGNKDLDIHFIDVGQGDSTLIKCPSGKNLLIDAGSLSGADADTVRDYLLEQLDGREQKIHTLIVTHPDADHYNLLASILYDIPVGQAFWTGAEIDYGKSQFRTWFFNTTFKKFNLTEADFDSESRPNNKIDCGKAEAYILAAGIPAAKAKDRKSASSIVLMIRHGNFKAIFTGDATMDTETKILDRYSADWLNIDLLKVGHHGSSVTSTSSAWAEILSPEVAVVSAGDENGFGHPKEEVIQKLELYTDQYKPHAMKTGSGKKGNYKYTYRDDYTEAIFSTVSSGGVEVKSDGEKWNVEEEINRP